MKIIHCADLHLDSNMTSNLTREQAKARKLEILRTFTRMVEYAAANQVRAILIAGDLFDTRNVSAVVRNQIRDVICANPKIDFLYLKGNHDEDNFLTKLEEIPQNLLLFGEDWVSYVYGRVVIAGLELAGSRSAAALHSLALEPENYNIVMLHGQLSGYGKKEDAAVISMDLLKNRSIDYLALGHVHEHMTGQLDARGVFCYPGCLEGRGYDECGEHGFVLIDIDERNHKASCRFIPFAFRRIYSVEVDVTGAMTTAEAAARIETLIAEKEFSSGSMVRFVLTGKVDVESEINTAFLEEQFSEYFFAQKVVDHTEIRIDYMEYEKDASLKGEFIRMVMESGLPEDKKSAVIRCGIQALAGEEL